MAEGDVWLIAIKGTLLGQEYVNGFAAQLTSAGATVEDAIDDIVTTFYTPVLAGVITNQLSLTMASARQQVNPQVLFEKAISLTGAQAGEALPPQCAFVITLRTGIAGRSRRGRLYIGGHIEANESNGVFAGATVTGMQGWADGLVALAGAGGTSPDWRWGVWSKKLGEPTPGNFNVGAGFRTITEVLARSIVYTQRRRTLGHGA